LAIVVVFPVPLTPTTRETNEPALVDLDPAVAHRCLEQSDHLLTQRLACLDRVADLATSHALLESFQQGFGGRHTQVGLNEQRFQVIEELAVDLRPLEKLNDLAKDSLPATLQARFQLWAGRGPPAEKTTEDHARLLVPGYFPGVWRRSDCRGAIAKYSSRAALALSLAGAVRSRCRAGSALRRDGGAPRNA
jgi:hypothetical protein